MINVTIWNEYVHEKINPAVAAIYPRGIHEAIKDGIQGGSFAIMTATLEQPEHGLDEQTLHNTDVLIWWGHRAHHEVEDVVVEAVHRRVLQGMGLIVLHSAHVAKIFTKLMGTTCELKWRDTGEKERIWIVDPAHPISMGLGECIVLDQEEMYGEHFDIPAPDELVFISWFEGGEVFRSGVTYHRGQGKIFYFRPGHETFPTYYNQDVLQVIVNAVKWCASGRGAQPKYGNAAPLEAIGDSQ